MVMDWMVEPWLLKGPPVPGTLRLPLPQAALGTCRSDAAVTQSLTGAIPYSDLMRLAASQRQGHCILYGVISAVSRKTLESILFQAFLLTSA